VSRARPAAGLLAHRIDGDGEPLLLLNGIAMTMASWEPIAAPLAERFRVIRCDLRGQLLSPGKPPTDLGGQVAEVVALLNALGVEQAAVVATSFGGAVGALLAARHPERVSALVTIASAVGFADSMAREVARWREAALSSVSGDDRGALSDALEPVVYSPSWLAAHRAERVRAREATALLPERWFRDLADLLVTAGGASVAADLPAVRCPTLVIAAGEDRFIPRERCRAIAETIPGARFEVVEGAGHAVVVERPEELVARIEAFLAGVPAKD
jgi:pimeloyl-ACP methyl ester carboxylesterase